MKILEYFNIAPNDLSLYNDALSHTSYINEVKKGNSYERLEFLGDAVLDLIISEYLFNNFKEKEGDMTKIRASYVCENALYEYALSIKLNEEIKLGQGEKKSDGIHKKAIVADVFEAFLGAVYLDQGLDKVKEIVNKVIIPMILDPTILFFEDYKSALQEYVQTDRRTVLYDVIKETGPSHNKEFEVTVKVNNLLFGRGIGNSKKEAEQEAAKDALSKMI